MQILFMGMAESMGQSGAEGASPASTRFTPSMATIAPLSVHSLSRGMRTSTPARSPYSSSFARSCDWRRTLRLRSESWNHTARTRRMALRARTVATESASEAHTSSMGTSRPAACCSSIHRATAVLTPEKLKSYGCAAPAFP